MTCTDWIVLGIVLFIGLIQSIYYGLFSYDIFTHPHAEEDYQAYYEDTCVLKIHNFYVNFIGVAIGWGLIFLLYKELSYSWTSVIDFKDITLVHGFIFTMALLGLFGVLPNTFWGLSISFKVMTDKLFGQT
jgi:hypothetical protein